jgi:hypothetical protein
MKPDSFKSQLQAVLTAYYEEIKAVLGASGCPKTKIVKRLFKAAAAPAGSGCSPYRRCSSCYPAAWEEPAAAPAVAESAPSQARKEGGRGSKKTKG